MTRKNQTRRSPKRKVTRLSHPVAAKLGILHHDHTGKVVHRHHTSYAILTILLVVTGFFIFIGYDITRASEMVNTVSVDLHVTATPPKDGAIITTPKDGDVFTKPVIPVEGTCAITSEVVMRSNDQFVGSTICTTSGTFGLNIQLFEGMNTLTALNYNGVNQAGPATPPVNVRYTPDFAAYITKGLSMSWLDSPVPIYFLAVAIVLGFWAGDYFERSIRYNRKHRRIRHRHA